MFERFLQVDNSRCSGLVTKTFGLPCTHVLHDYDKKGQSFERSDRHPQWLLEGLTEKKGSTDQLEITFSIPAKLGD
jgi:hypothetical protein